MTEITEEELQEWSKIYPRLSETAKVKYKKLLNKGVKFLKDVKGKEAEGLPNNLFIMMNDMAILEMFNDAKKKKEQEQSGLEGIIKEIVFAIKKGGLHG